MVKGVLFDLGDVFFEAHYWRRWMFDDLLKQGFYDGSFVEFYNLYESFLKKVYNGETSYSRGFTDFLDHLRLPDSDGFMKLSFEKKVHFEQTRSLFDGVKKTLADLKGRNIANVVITDNELSENEVRKSVVERHGINHLIDRVITSLDVGVLKPDPMIFKIALDSVSVKDEEALFVAHDKDEIAGARAIGLKVVEFNNYLGLNTDADIRIDSFRQILDFV